MACKARLIGVLCAVLLGLVVPLRAAGADEATETFNALYAADLARVRGTGDTRDDVELAARLVAAAKRAADQPAFVTILCEKACDLALGHPTGYPTALKAMDFLAQTVPEKAAACAARTLGIRQKQYDTSRGDARPPAAETLIDALVAAADAKIEAGAPAEAATLLVRARNVARAVSSPRLAELETRAQTLTQRIATDRRISDLVALLEKSPGNVAAREELVRLYLVDLDDPAEAAKHLEGAKAPSLLKYVPAAAKGVEAPPALACLELGEWYRDLATKAPKHARAAMYARAKAYLQRFLEIHTAKDLTRTRGDLALDKVRNAIEQLGGRPQVVSTAAKPTPGTPTAPAAQGSITKPGRWIDVLALVDPAKDAVAGTWERQGSTLTVVKRARSGRVVLPVVIEGSYELHVAFTRLLEKNRMIVIILPVGSTAVALQMSRGAGNVAGLGLVGGKEADENESTLTPGTLQTGHRYDLQIRVEVEGRQARIRSSLDGKPHVTWQGLQSALSPSPKWVLPQPGCPGVGTLSCEGIFHSVRLRMLSGKARLLRQ